MAQIASIDEGLTPSTRFKSKVTRIHVVIR